MKRALIILLLACCPLSYGQTVQDYSGQSAAQLSAMTDYVTIPNTSYWNTHAYLQLRTLFNWVAPVDYVTDIYGSADSMYYSLGDTNQAPYIRGMIDVNDPKYIFIPPSVTLAAGRNYPHDGGGQAVIDISGTHDVIVTGGGTIYGRSDSSYYNNGQTEYDSGVEIKASSHVIVRDLTIKYPAGDGITGSYIYFPTRNEVDTSYQFVESSDIKIDNVSIYCPQINGWNWPVGQQIGRNAIALVGAKNVIISNSYLRGGNPAVIDIEGNTSKQDTIDNVIITNCIIDGLSQGRYTVGAVVSDTQFYLKPTSGKHISIAADSLNGVSIMSNDYENQYCRSDSTASSVWQSIVSNTATSGGNTTITVAQNWYSNPTGWYAVIYDHDGYWPSLPDSSELFGDALVTAYGTKTITVTGITATLNQLTGHKLYFTTNPIHGIKRHIEDCAASSGDSILVTVNDSFRGLTPVYGKDIGLGDGFGCGILLTGSGRYRNIIIANNVIKNTYSYGLRIQQGGTDSTHKIIVANNRFENIGTNGIETAGSGDIKISGNYIRNANVGINIMGLYDQSVEYNTVEECPVGGIWVLGSPGNDSTGTITGTVVNGNVVRDCGRVATPSNKSIWLAWTKRSACAGNTIINADTSTSIYQYAVQLTGCKDLFLGENYVIGHGNRIYSADAYTTFRNTTFSQAKTYFGVNYASTAFPFVVKDSTGGVSYTAIAGGVVYPNAVNARNKIYINGGTLIMQGSTHATLASTDTSSTSYDVFVAHVDTLNQPIGAVNAPLELENYTTAQIAARANATEGMLTYDTNKNTLVVHNGSTFRPLSIGFLNVQANTYDAAAGDMWVNASHDTLWYSADGTNAAFILIGGYVAKH